MTALPARLLVSLGALPLVTAGAVALPGAMTGAAVGACAPVLTASTTASHAAKMAHVKTAAPDVAKVGRKYVAKVALRATQGSATVSVTQSVCPDGAAGAVASTRQSASAKGAVSKTVKAHGSSKKAAVRAAKAKAKKAAAALKANGATKKGRKKAVKRAVAAARAAATAKAHDALYLSDVVYLSMDAAQILHVTATPPAGKPTTRLQAGAAGDIVLTVPAGFDPYTNDIAMACIKRAPAWPTSFVFDGGDVVAPVLQAAAATNNALYAINGAPISNVDGATSGSTTSSDQMWEAGWHQENGAVTYHSGVGSATAYAGAMECFYPNEKVPQAYTASIHGAHVGTVVDDAQAAYAKVIGGVPVQLR